MLKFATFQITSAILVDPKMSRTAALQTLGHRAVFDYEPRPGYLYVRSRAISSRCNDNFDEFPAEEIKAAYRTFIGKPVFVNHHNDNHRRARGVIIDAALHEDRNPDGSPDTWSEVLMEVDAVRFPILAKAIIAGEVDRTSMGTDVAYSICSACGNKASSPAEYCAHIPKMKGKRIYQVNASAGSKEGVLIREKCFGLKFFENSLLVEDPADPTAYFLGVDTRGVDGGKTAVKVAQAIVAEGEKVDPAEPKPDKQRFEGVTLAQDDDGHYVRTHRARSDSYASPEAIPDSKIEFIRSTGAAIPVSDGDRLFYQHMHEQGQRDSEMTDHMSTAVTDLLDPHALKAHMFTAHGWDESDLWRNSHPQDHPRMSPGTDDDRPLRHDEVRGAHAHEHEVEYPEDYPHTTLGNSHFHHTGARTASGLLPQDHGEHGPWNLHGQCKQCGHTPHTEADDECDDDYCQSNGFPEGWHTKGEHMTPAHLDPHSDQNMDVKRHLEDAFGGADHKDAEWLLGQQSTGPTRYSMLREAASKAEDFLAANPPSVHHLLERFHSATPEQHDAGLHWYQDSHHIAKAIGHGDTAKAAGLMGVYSAGTPVAPNYHYASRSILHNTAVGGKTNPLPPEHSDFHGKPNASAAQAEQATRMLNGEHHSKVLTSPKVSNYAHLIEHGDNEPGREGPERVVVDRHAVSAAIGRRVTDNEFTSLNLSTTDNGKKIRGGGGAVHDYGDDKNSRYHHIANVYRQAAEHLRSEGHDVKAHQVQAVAWGVQKSRNDAEDAAHVEANGPVAGNIKGRQNSQERQRDAWEKHHRDVHDELGLPANPRGHWGSKQAFIPTEDDMKDFTDAISPRVAYGETKAPADVDTLRDEECPVCGERDSYDGNSCQQCGFDAPPQMFQDPDLGAAKALDLRKDIAQDAGTLPGMVTDQDTNAGMPGEVPGSDVPGSDQVPVDPSMVDGEGNVTPGADPAQIAQQQMDMLQSGQPITPDMIGPNGEMAMDPQLDPEAANGHFDQGGEAFTPGPNVPGEPGGPEDPISPDEVDEEGNPLDGQEEVIPAREGDPGTPADGVADLQCPACGFQSDAEQPQSVDMDDQALAAPGAGTMAGDVCPNCQQAQLLSVGEMEQMNGAPARV